MSHKYIRIKKDIINNIQNGMYGPGDQIESENELVKRYDVSRMTVRKALKELQVENIVTSVHGKGTFVSKFHNSFSGAHFVSYKEHAYLIGKPYRVDVIGFSSVLPDFKMQKIFEITEKDRVWEIKRLHYFDYHPSVYEISYIPWTIAPDYHYTNAFGSIFNYLDTMGHQINSCIETKEAILSDLETSNLLEIEPMPIIKNISQNYDKFLNTVEYSISFFHPENYATERHLSRRYIKTAHNRILYVAKIGVVSTEICDNVRKYIYNNELEYEIFGTEIKDLEKYIDLYDLILLDPPLRYLESELKKAYPKKIVYVMSMETYAKMDAKEIVEAFKKRTR